MQGGEIFVPKCPSFKIIDLARSLKNDISFKNIGLRPGEKLHEVLCPKDDYLNTIEFSEFYLIKPTINFGVKQNYIKIPTRETGKYVKKNFEYDSFNNKDKLNLQQIKRFFKEKKVF
jgi:UDP-N-acetylglucosamine 4,6-dehydratase